MTYRLLLFSLLSLLAIEVQSSNRFSDKVNMNKFTKEYREIDRDKSNIKKSKANIIKLIMKYSNKYNVDLSINDTIFILETCSVESMTCYGSLWSKKERIDFKIFKKFKILPHNYFKEEEINALFKWDMNIFKSLDEEGRLWLPSSSRDATRIIIGKGEVDIERAEYFYH
ncbi:hypothetical protein GGR21_004303 [Dysgonomonas hofstadii]|uniref:Uncharacterized protein n=1 Tax=Dysgonomonas hofstadii TaxID=637886 RepID=A0A840CXS1_9BACT|nr:hypothetical protein [Dysgonomonas hofstadii]MBB4038364.1 hypothetical protein [Dysgonomonas hofstadii]